MHAQLINSIKNRASSVAALQQSAGVGWGKTNIFPFSDLLFSDFFVLGLGFRV